jgi:hypothetical protein
MTSQKPEAEQILTAELREQLEQDPGRLAVVSVEAIAPEPASFSWRDHLLSQNPGWGPGFLTAAPAFQHAINLVADSVSGLHPVNPAHKEPIIFRMPVANGRDHRSS